MLKNNKMNYLMYLVIIIFGILIIYNVPKYVYEDNANELENVGLSQIISSDKIYIQYFNADKKVKAINIRTATYTTDIIGNYVVEVGKNDEELYRVVISGDNIKDNEYLKVNLPKCLENGEGYYFTIYALESNQDTLALWMSGIQNEANVLFESTSELGYQINFTLTEEVSNRGIVAIIIICFFLVVLCAHRFTNNKIIVLIYIVGLLVICCRMSYFYEHTWLGMYDDMAHISYLTYVEQNFNFVPDFEEIKLLIPQNAEVIGTNQTLPLLQNKGVYHGKISDTICYLGHPPLYYRILSIFNCVDVSADGIVSINLDVLRLCNVALFLMAVLVIFYIGFTRIEKKPAYHLLYVSIITMLPMFSMLGLTINNDNLTFLTVAISFLGAARFVEGKYDFKTFLLIALGICGTVMTKLTAGMILVIVAIIIIGIELIKDKNYKSVINKYMMYTVPIYILALLYYIILYMRYGTVQLTIADLLPYEEFVQYGLFYYPEETRIEYSFLEYVYTFFHVFLGQWENGAYSEISADVIRANDFINCLYIIVFIMICIEVKNIFSSNKFENLLGAFSVGIIFTIITEVFNSYGSYLDTGRGVKQSRYYVCVLFVIALLVINFIKKIMASKKEGSKIQKINNVINVEEIVCVMLSLAFMYSGWLVFYTIS